MGVEPVGSRNATPGFVEGKANRRDPNPTHGPRVEEEWKTTIAVDDRVPVGWRPETQGDGTFPRSWAGLLVGAGPPGSGARPINLNPRPEVPRIYLFM